VGDRLTLGDLAPVLYSRTGKIGDVQGLAELLAQRASASGLSAAQIQGIQFAELAQYPDLAQVDLGALPLLQVPGLAQMPLSRLPRWQALTIAQVPMLGQIPFSTLFECLNPTPRREIEGRTEP
jgi:hypothetical protein